MRPKNAIGKTLSSSPSFRSNPIRTITGPMIRRQKSSRQVGVCGSALEHAPVPRKTSRIRRSRSRRLKRPLAPARRSAAVCGGLGSRAKKEPKKAYRDFQAIRRKGVVQGQSRQALMSWRRTRLEATRALSWTSRPLVQVEWTARGGRVDRCKGRVDLERTNERIMGDTRHRRQTAV